MSEAANSVSKRKGLAGAGAGERNEKSEGAISIHLRLNGRWPWPCPEAISRYKVSLRPAALAPSEAWLKSGNAALS